MYHAEYQTVEYHSVRWGELVEQGWVTMFVVNGQARMIKEGR